jgi:hypothetical protein
MFDNLLNHVKSKLPLAWRASKRDLLDHYGEILESAGMFEDISKLPAPKAAIKKELILFAKCSQPTVQRDIYSAYLSLAIFQDLNLEPVRSSNIEALRDLSGESLVEALVGMKDNIEANSVMTDVVNAERRALALEWQRAGFTE